jgi:hypothetical protein
VSAQDQVLAAVLAQERVLAAVLAQERVLAAVLVVAGPEWVRGWVWVLAVLLWVP